METLPNSAGRDFCVLSTDPHLGGPLLDSRVPPLPSSSPASPSQPPHFLFSGGLLGDYTLAFANPFLLSAGAAPSCNLPCHAAPNGISMSPGSTVLSLLLPCTAITPVHPGHLVHSHMDGGPPCPMCISNPHPRPPLPGCTILPPFPPLISTGETSHRLLHRCTVVLAWPWVPQGNGKGAASGGSGWCAPHSALLSCPTSAATVTANCTPLPPPLPPSHRLPTCGSGAPTRAWDSIRRFGDAIPLLHGISWHRIGKNTSHHVCRSTVTLPLSPPNPGIWVPANRCP
eukprot:GGOE01030052.1.p1 GENE.GGOE01030052.1~~GGOE01030052.1.p1  ORF type:complete len:320 (-),score=7.25 GGOE01030052.1:1071-1928(-)